jgi:hypothetical protein
MSAISLWSLLRPIHKTQFMENYWGRKWLQIERNGQDYFRHLVSLSDLEQILFDTEHARDGVDAAGGFKRDNKPAGASSRSMPRDFINAWFQGETLIFRSLDRRLPALSEFARQLEWDLSCGVKCNLYLSPPNSKGFEAHYDTHDIFILQVLGSKYWRIGKREIEAPIEAQTCDPANTRIYDDHANVVLNQGDLLYLPGGWIHDAETASGISCHITVGIFSNTYLDLILAASLEAALRDPEFRRPLPIDGASTSGAVTAGRLIARIADLDLANAAQTLKERLIAEQPRPTTGVFGLVDLIGDIGENDLLQSHPNASVSRSANAGELKLLAFGKCLTIPARLEQAVRYCLQEAPFRIASMPGSLDDNMALVKRLLIEGVLKKVGAAV